MICSHCSHCGRPLEAWREGRLCYACFCRSICSCGSTKDIDDVCCEGCADAVEDEKDPIPAVHYLNGSID